MISPRQAQQMMLLRITKNARTTAVLIVLELLRTVHLKKIQCQPTDVLKCRARLLNAVTMCRKTLQETLLRALQETLLRECLRECLRVKRVVKLVGAKVVNKVETQETLLRLHNLRVKVIKVVKVVKTVKMVMMTKVSKKTRTPNLHLHLPQNREKTQTPQPRQLAAQTLKIIRTPNLNLHLPRNREQTQTTQPRQLAARTLKITRTPQARQLTAPPHRLALQRLQTLHHHPPPRTRMAGHRQPVKLALILVELRLATKNYTQEPLVKRAQQYKIHAVMTP